MHFAPSLRVASLAILLAASWPAGNDCRADDDRADLVFGAPPRESYAREIEVYQPLVDYLSKITGRSITYRFADNWLAYSKNMASGAYDIVFDGPAFNGWRAERLRHMPLVKLPENFVFVVIIKADDDRTRTVSDLAGRLVCAHAPPNLGTLTLLSLFQNPARQPVIVEIQGWANGYKGLIDSKCVGTVLPLGNLAKYEAGRKKLTKVLYQHKPLPNQALSVGPRLSPEMRTRIAQALMSNDGQSATQKLRAIYAGAEFVPANKGEYVGLGDLLSGNFYFR